MLFYFLPLFTIEIIGVHIISTSKDECFPKNLPFPSICAAGCPTRFHKPYCVQYALASMSSLSDDEIILYADNDVIFSNWTEARFTHVLEKYGNDKIVFNSEYGSNPHIYSKNTSEKKFNELNAGVFFGRKKLVVDFLDHLSKAIHEYQLFNLIDSKHNPPDMDYFEFPHCADQGFFLSFYHNSPAKPMVIDFEREVTFLIMDLWKEVLNDEMRTPRNIWEAAKPGGDLCDMTKLPGIPSEISNKSEKKWKADPCNQVLQFEECSVNPTFYRHPNGVLSQVTDPLAVHFAGKDFKGLFKDIYPHLINLQRQSCNSTYSHEIIEVLPETETTTSFILNSTDSLRIPHS